MKICEANSLGNPVKPNFTFSQNRRKDRGGSKIKRTTGYGTWKAKRDQPSYLDDNKKYHIGSLRAFSFFSKETQQWPTLGHA
jgi:hypothetical protein